MSAHPTHPRRVAHPSAYAAAGSLEPGDEVPWRGLEIAAFTEHRDVQEALDPTGKWPRVHGRPRGGCALLLVFVLGALGLPLLGLVAMAVRGRQWDGPQDDGFAVTVSGLSYAGAAVAVVVLGLAVLVDLRRGRPVEGGLGFFLVPGGLAAATLVASHVRAVDGVLDVRLATIWLTLALALVVGAWASVAARAARSRAPEVPDGPLKHVREPIARIDAAEQARVREDLRQAVEDLRARGVVGAAVADRALTAPLGMLAHEVSQGGS